MDGDYDGMMWKGSEGGWEC